MLSMDHSLSHLDKHRSYHGCLGLSLQRLCLPHWASPKTIILPNPVIVASPSRGISNPFRHGPRRLVSCPGTYCQYIGLTTTKALATQSGIPSGSSESYTGKDITVRILQGRCPLTSLLVSC